jgi:parallel beta-helix repeat protein
MITKNTISGYRKNGITFGPVLYPGYGGVRGVISNNSIIGAGPTTTISQNGIQVSENNAATIINNKISNHIYDVPDSFWASGILIHQSNNVFTSRNILSDNQAGINIMQGSYNKITNNTINGNSFTKAGITLNGSTNKELPTTNANSIEGNTISGGSVGIWASNTASTTYSNNIISSSTDNGIYSWNSDNSTFSKNTISKIHSPTNNAWGIVLDGDTVLSTTSSNVLSSNVIKTSDLGFWVGTSSYNNLLTNNIFNDKKVNTHLTVSGNYITSPVSSKEISILEKKGMVLGSTSFNFLKDLEVGNFGSDVTHLQELLITEGLLKTETTGYFGTETRNALIVWQKKNNLPTTGYFGVLTRNTINSKNK